MATQEWTVWRGGFAGSHRHVTNTKARWLKESAVGRAPIDRQRRNVGLGPLWTGAGEQDAKGFAQPITLFNAFPKHWGRRVVSSGPSLPKCICHTAIPRGEIETFQGSARQRSRALAKGVLSAGRPQHSAGVEQPAAKSRQSCSGIELLRESHREMLDAINAAAESGSPSLRRKASSVSRRRCWRWTRPLLNWQHYVQRRELKHIHDINFLQTPA